MGAIFVEGWWMLIAVGLGAGLLSGLFGVGGGIVMVPAMVLAISMPQKTAQGTSLAVMVPLALVGALRYWRETELNLSMLVVVLVAAGAIVGSLVGVNLAMRVSGDLLRRAFAVLMIVVAVRMLIAPSGEARGKSGSGTAVEKNAVPSEPVQKGGST